MLSSVIAKMQTIAKVDKEMHMEGRQLVMIMSKGGIRKAETNDETNIGIDSH